MSSQIIERLKKTIADHLVRAKEVDALLKPFLDKTAEEQAWFEEIKADLSPMEYWDCQFLFNQGLYRMEQQCPSIKRFVGRFAS